MHLSLLSAPRRVLVVDGTEVCRVGLAAVIDASPRFSVCAASGDYSQVERLTAHHRPELTIVDPFYGCRDGLTWLKSLVSYSRGTRILAVSLNSETTYAERALRAGAAGYWMKSGSGQSLLQALETILDGNYYVSQSVASLAIRQLLGRPVNGHGKIGRLSDRELHVFSLIGANLGVGRIAQELGISRKTVETHCEHIKLKLGYEDAKVLKSGARTFSASIA